MIWKNSQDFFDNNSLAYGNKALKTRKYSQDIPSDPKSILDLIFEVNITQVSYVIQCIIANAVEFSKVQF